MQFALQGNLNCKGHSTWKSAQFWMAALAINESVTLERLAKCGTTASDLETIVGEFLTEAWVPRDPTELLVTIQCVHNNLRSVQSDVAAALDVVLLECRPNELYRAFVALSFARQLEFERDILCDALVKCMKCPCGCGAFVSKGWMN